MSLCCMKSRTGFARRRFTWRTKVASPCWWWRLPRPVRETTIWGSSRTFYYQVGVQKYVIVDRGPEGEDPVHLLGYQRGPTGWLPLPPDAQGRLDLAPVGLSMGIEDDRPWFYDAVTGVREPDRPEWRQALAEARERAQEGEARIQKAEVRAQDAATRATTAEASAQAEAQARIALDARVRALERQLQRQAGGDAPSPSVEPQAEEPC